MNIHTGMQRWMASMAIVLLAMVLCAHAQEWQTTTLWDAHEKIQGVRFGDADPRHPGIEAVAVTRSGTVAIAGFTNGKVWSDTIYRHGVLMTGLCIADVDPTIPGNEIYIGGGRTTKAPNGEVVQIALVDGHWRARTVWMAPDVVHTFDTLPRLPGGTARLVAPTYAGTIHLLIPTKTGLWRDTLLYRHTATGTDTNDLVVKDMHYGTVAGRANQLLFCTKGGDMVDVDLSDPSRSGRIYRQKFGIARFTIVSDGTLYGSCNDGCLIHLSYVQGAWKVDTLYRDYAEGRGVVIGRFPCGGRACSLAAFGYARTCRLFYDNGIGWDTYTLFHDLDCGHWMVVADVIPGNDADEMLLGGYSGRMTLISRRRGNVKSHTQLVDR